LKDKYSTLTIFKVYEYDYKSDERSKIISETFSLKKKKKQKKEKHMHLNNNLMRNAWLYTLIPLLSHLCLLGPIILLKKMGPTTLSPLSLTLLVQVDKSGIEVG
jgi:hypothetical protein